MSAEKRRHFPLWLTKGEHSRLKVLANRQERSMTAVIRELLDEELKLNEVPEDAHLEVVEVSSK